MSRFTKGWEALQTKLTQSVETVTRTGTLSYRESDVDSVDLADNVADYYQLYESTPLVRASIDKFAADVVAPGYRVDGESEEAVDYLMDTWLPQAGILAGETHQDFSPFLYSTVIQRWARGGALLEHVRPEPTADQITGVNHIPPETITAQTQPNTNILLAPDATGGDIVETPRDEAAAYIQYDDDALLGPFSNKDPVPLSQNDVTRTILNPDIGDLWGHPVTETIAEELAGFKEILRDQEKAIKSKAYGIWSIGFGRDIVETAEYQEIIQWSDSEQRDFIENRVGELGPGDIIGHDGEISFEKFEGEIPDTIDHLAFYVNHITTALPTPKYVVGFESDINQFVTEAQDARYQQLIDQERQALERALSPLLQRVARQNLDIEDESLTLNIEPKADESPILSLSDEEVDRLGTYADAVDKLSGAADPATLISDEVLRELILRLPDDADAPDEIPLDEANEEVGEMFDQLQDTGDAEAD